ncbi:MAG TPA: hypothetical protein VMY78_09840 [Solirubrobacteraceae bacterium]|nr:hypothetical protein [Solirubrobacteraceae bacterium]
MEVPTARANQRRGSAGQQDGAPAPTDERHEVAGRRGRRLKATLYAGGWTLDLGIVMPGQPKAKAAITLDIDEVRQLAHRLDELADVMDVNRGLWEAQAA